MAEINKLNIKGVNYDIKAKYDEDGNEIDATYLKKKDNFAYGINTFTVENGKLTKMTIKSRDDGAVESVDVGADTSNLVDLTSAQSIGGVKTFTSEVKTNQIANVNDNAMVRFKETEGKNVFGGISYDCVLMGKSSRPFYSKDGSDFNGNEVALMSDVSETLVSANSYADTKASNVLSSAKSYTDTQVEAKQDKLTAGDGITISNNVISASGGSSGGGIKLYKHEIADGIIIISLSSTPLSLQDPSAIQNGNCISVYVGENGYYSSGLISYTSDQPWYVVHYYGDKNGTTYKSNTFYTISDTVIEL